MNTTQRDGNYEVLQGSGKTGDIVHQTQKMSGDKDFRNVSGLWYDKTIDFDAAREQLAIESKNRVDYLCKPSEMKTFIGDDGAVGFENSYGVFTPTEHAWNQFATRCGMPQTIFKYYAPRKVDAEMFVDIVDTAHTHLCKAMGDKKLRFRCYKDENGGSMRAVLTEQYAPIDNGWYLDQLERLIPEGRVSHFEFTNPDTASFNVLIPDSIRRESDSDYGGMISAGNCEIGTRRFEQYPSVFRAICMNGCIWDQKKGGAIRQVHRGKINLKELAAELEINIGRQIPLLTTGIDLLLAMRDWDLKASDKSAVAIKQILASVAGVNNYSGNQTVELFSQFNRYEKANKNAFGVVNAITRAGQESSASFWVKSDRLAGSIMESGEAGWDKILKRASTIDDSDIEKQLKRADQTILQAV